MLNQIQHHPLLAHHQMQKVASKSVNQSIAPIKLFALSTGIKCWYASCTNRLRSISTKGKQRLSPKGGPWGLFGWHVVRASHNSIIITEGEFDAMVILNCVHNGHLLGRIAVSVDAKDRQSSPSGTQRYHT